MPIPSSFAGLPLDRPLIMGVVNVTPDSFSDGGDFAEREAAIAQALRLKQEGADIIDVGGESARPGAAPIDPAEEIRRVVPVVDSLARAGAVVSIDTRRTTVMRAALAAGAAIVNDITALSDDGAIATVAEHNAAAILMHMQGEPATMQHEPHYDDVVEEVATYLEARIAACVAGGVPRERLAIDPGIGFGKAPTTHNLEILRHLERFVRTGLPILIGVSRKMFIGVLSRNEPPKERLPGSLAAALWAVQHGAHILRVHDVAATRQALAVWMALAQSKT
jgi:dihydropteroate synthase